MDKHEIIRIEPRMKPLFVRARAMRRRENKAGEYERLKKELTGLVGWNARIEELRSPSAYSAAINALCEELGF